jgi:hypothetical protein
MRNEWQEEPETRARMWVTLRLADKGLGPSVISEGFGVSRQPGPGAQRRRALLEPPVDRWTNFTLSSADLHRYKRTNGPPVPPL